MREDPQWDERFFTFSGTSTEPGCQFDVRIHEAGNVRLYMEIVLHDAHFSTGYSLF